MDDRHTTSDADDLKKLVEQLQQQNASLQQENASLQQEKASLQEELAAIQAQLAQSQAELSALTDAAHVLEEDRKALQEKIAELEAANQRLTDLVWGRRSERREEHPDQPTLFSLELSPEELAAKQAEIIAAEETLDEAARQELLKRLLERRRRRLEQKLRDGGREEFPPNLERRTTTLDLDEDAKQGLVLLDVKVTERLRFEKPTIYVERIERYEYVRPGAPEAGVFSHEVPLSILPGVKYDFSVIAAALSMKLSFHQPTYRQQDWFAQCGLTLSRSTFNDLFNYAVPVIEPLYLEAWRLLQQQPIILGDDTRVRLLTRGALSDEEVEKILQRQGQKPPGTGPPGSVISYAWLYTGLDGMAPYNIFHWSLTHENCWIDSHLEHFGGVFVGDATGPNARLAVRSDGRILHAGCNAHARREFIKAETTEPLHVAKALAFYARLYDIEDRARLMSAAERLELRRREAIPVWKQFGEWLDRDELKRILPKSPLGQALAYLRNQWVSLQVYLSDGRLPIDNNQSERMIRPLVIGRRNWTFLGHPAAAAGRLQLFSIASSAHRHDVIVHDYLEDVLKQLAYAQQREPRLLEPGSEFLQSLLPDHWAAAHPQSLRQGRRQEREDVADAKRIGRLQRRLKEREQQLAGAQSIAAVSGASD